MNIIPESVSFRPSSARPLSSSRPFFQAASVLLLAAPPVRLALPAPRPVPLLSAPLCAGLLSDGILPQYQTARSQNRDYLIRDRRSPFDDLIAHIDQMGPFRPSKRPMPNSPPSMSSSSSVGVASWTIIWRVATRKEYKHEYPRL